jgi:hypothetical protein
MLSVPRGMKRPVVLIVGVAAGILLVAGAGASAHTALHLVNPGANSGNVLSDDATSPSAESPEPSESPEASPTAEPTEKAEPTETPETEAADNDADNDNQDENDNEDNNQAQQSGSGGDDGGSGD